MFQRDYWKLSDAELQALADKYKLSSHSTLYDGAIGYFDRDKVISGLLLRDSALRTKLTVVLSILAFLISIAAFVKSFFTTATH